jgi:hypothetical protein
MTVSYAVHSFLWKFFGYGRAKIDLLKTPINISENRLLIHHSLLRLLLASFRPNRV